MKIKYLFLIVILFSLFSCNHLKKNTVDLGIIFIDSIPLIDGMNGCENLYLDDESSDIYVTDLNGYLYKISKYENVFAISDKIKLFDYAMGIDCSDDGYLYVATSSDDWHETGGPIVRINKDLSGAEEVSENIKGINGLTINSNIIYYSYGNMNYFSPEGGIGAIKLNNGRSDLSVINDQLESANGLFYSKDNNLLYFTEVFNGAYSLNPLNNSIDKVFGKSRMIEGFDDMCIDSYGNFWVADQPNGFIKMYNPTTQLVTYFRSDEVGIASSCRIRMEDGKEVIYITELKKSKDSETYDGRGVFYIELETLLNFVK